MMSQIADSTAQQLLQAPQQAINQQQNNQLSFFKLNSPLQDDPVVITTFDAQEKGNLLEQTATQIHFNFGGAISSNLIQQPGSFISRGGQHGAAQTFMPRNAIDNQEGADSYLDGIDTLNQPITARQLKGQTKSDLDGLNQQFYPPKQQLQIPLNLITEGFEGGVTGVGVGISSGNPMMDTVEDELEDYNMMKGFQMREEVESPDLIMPHKGDNEAHKKISKSEKKQKLQFKDTIDVHSSGESCPEDASQMYSPLQQYTQVTQSPQINQRTFPQFIPDEAKMHKEAYEKVSKLLPPNPILPKSFLVHDDSPRSGGEQAYIKLLKFRGKDFGRSKFEIEKGVNQIEFPEGVTLKSIFASAPESVDERKTAFGEIVYQRHALDFSNKSHQPGAKKDEVIEENLLDVRRILKNSQAVTGITTGSGAQGPNQQKKGLVNLQGVDTYYKKKDQNDKTLIFESRFESGNLASALKVSDAEYHLLLQNDVNTSGHTQWFFYRVQNTSKFTQVKFNMLNLSKPDSLFNEGMKVLVYSEKHSEDKDIGWHRTCSKIAYYHNGIKKDNQKKKAPAGQENANSKSLYTLTFTYDFMYDDDTVYFAYCYPYGYSDMLEDLNKISSDPVKSSFTTRKTLCMSLAGNRVEMLTITSKNNLENLSKRKGVFITARVHPGESVGSWMMKGVIDYLTDENNEEAETLRQNFVFKIIPMLNPDGVINGNYRCSLAGCDLNRRWKAPSKVLHPCIYNTKQLLQQFSKERELVVFCDFHGHSRRKNIFMYGCQNEQNPEETRMYPFLMSKICPFFSFNYSRFGNQKSKEATARIAMFNEIKVSAIYTMESSFCGMDEGPFANYHFSTENLMQTGRDFCRTLLLFCSIPLDLRFTTIMMKQIQNLIEYKRQAIEKESPHYKDAEIEAMTQFFDKMRQAQADKKEITTKRMRKGLLQVLRTAHDVGNENETSSSAGSDKAPSEDNLEPEEMQMVVPEPNEDEQMKGKKGKKKDLTQTLLPQAAQDTATSISPQRKPKIDPNLRRISNMTKIKVIGAKSLKKDNSKSLIKVEEEKKEEAIIDEEITNPVNEADQPSNCNNEGEDTVTHKKKRKRNVDSRDAWTQTDRSDYMLIKYRQKQKQALQMAKAQKLTKEEQAMYEQALLQYKQQQQQMIKTLDPSVQTPPTIMNNTSPIKGGKESGLNVNRLVNNKKPFDNQGGANATINSREKAESTIIGNNPSGPQSVNVSRNLHSASSSSKNNNRKNKNVVNIAGRASQLIVQQNGQLFQMINNQPVPIKTQQLNEAQLKHLQSLLDSQAQNPTTHLGSLAQGLGNGNGILPQINHSSGGKRKSQGVTNLSAPPGVSIATKFSSPQKKTIVQDLAAGQFISSQQPTFSLANQVLMNAGLPSDLTSSHSSQRIVNSKLQVVPNFDNSNNGYPLMIIPNQTSQRSSLGQLSGNQNALFKNNQRKISESNHAQGDLTQPVNQAPVLENAYIQKRLMQQQQQQLIDSQQNEYVGIKPIGGATFFGNPSQTLEYHIGGGELSRRKIGGVNGSSIMGGNATNAEFFTASNNNAYLKKMLENQWQQQVNLQTINQSGTQSIPNPSVNQSFVGAINSGQGSNSQLFMGSSSNTNNPPSTYPKRGGRKNVSQKNPQSFQQQFILQGSQQPVSSVFTNVQGRQSVQHNNSNIISSAQQSNPLGMLQGSPIKMIMNSQQQQQQQQQNNVNSSQSPVKINIVNVHNQFNIHNNIIINNNPSATQFMNGSNSSGATNFYPQNQPNQKAQTNPINISQAPLGTKQPQNKKVQKQ